MVRPYLVIVELDLHVAIEPGSVAGRVGRRGAGGRRRGFLQCSDAVVRRLAVQVALQMEWGVVCREAWVSGSGVNLVKTRIGFELESFATSSETTLGVSSCAKPSLPWGRRVGQWECCGLHEVSHGRPRRHCQRPQHRARRSEDDVAQAQRFIGAPKTAATLRIISQRSQPSLARIR